MRAANWAPGAMPFPAPDEAQGAEPAASGHANVVSLSTSAAALHPPADDAPPKQALAPPSPLQQALSPIHQWLRHQWPPLLLGIVSIGGVLLLWHLATRYRLDFYIRFTNIPTPMAVFDKLMEVNRSPQFLTNIGISVRRILLGFAVATLLGVSLGLLIGRYRPVRMLSLPALEVFRPIPAIAWVPMSIMLWPDNEVSIVFITFIGAFFPILLNTIHGVEAMDPVLLRAARCLGCPERRLLWQVMLPGALPHIFTGLAVGMGVAWVSLIAAEMISGQFGIGYFTWEAYSLISYAEIALGMITIGVLGLLCSGGIRLAARLIMPWRAASSKGAA